MSQTFDYIYLKDKKIEEIKVERVTASLEIGQHELIGETTLCETGIVRDLFIGEINNGVIIFGQVITYKLTYYSEIRNNFLKEFPDCEIFAKSYNDRVMGYGFVLAINGEFICAKEAGENSYTEGSTTPLEEEIRANEKETEEYRIIYNLMQKFEEQYLGYFIHDFDCTKIKLLKYQLIKNVL